MAGYLCQMSGQQCSVEMPSCACLPFLLSYPWCASDRPLEHITLQNVELYTCYCEELLQPTLEFCMSDQPTTGTERTVSAYDAVARPKRFQ
jgi:hypothetical protein